MKIKEIFESLQQAAPLTLAESWDNVGLIVGDAERETERVMTALDCTLAVIEAAGKSGCGLIVTHHPLYITPPHQISGESAPAQRILALAERKIALISLHTNADMAVGGVNDLLAERLGLTNVTPLGESGDSAYLRIGTLDTPLSPEQFAERVKTKLGAPAVKYNTGGRVIRTVASMGGAGGDWFEDARYAGADAYVTGDVKHHLFTEAEDAGITLIDAGHLHTELPVVDGFLEPLLQKMGLQTERFDQSGLIQAV